MAFPDKVRRVDTHAHILPDFYREAMINAGLKESDGMPAIPVRCFLQRFYDTYHPFFVFISIGCIVFKNLFY